MLTMMLWMAACAPADPPFEAAAPRDDVAGKNVLVVLLDDVATDRIGAYGEHERPARTPTLDALAAEGLRFTEAYAYPVCSPSRAAFLTGRHGRRTGIGYNVRPDADYSLPLHEGLIPELMAAGQVPYTSAGVGKWHLQPRNGQTIQHPLQHGFDHWSGSIGNLVKPDTYRDYSWYHPDGTVEEHASDYLTSREIDEAVRLVTTLPEPWFVLAAIHAPHGPWSAPPAELLTSPVADDAPVADLYDAMLEAADHELARLLAVIDRDDTLIVVMGDNGTPKDAVRPPIEPKHAKGSVYEAGVRVPWIVAGLGIEPGVSDELVHLVDWFPTLAQMSGTDPLRPGYDIDGQSLWPLLKGEPHTPRSLLFTEKYYTLRDGASVRAVRGPRYKLIERQSGFEGLFDLQGRHDDGPNLLKAKSALSAEEEEAYQRLRSELTRVHTELGRSPADGGLGCL
jgi:arylsulfatase A-like enzyme